MAVVIWTANHYGTMLSNDHKVIVQLTVMLRGQTLFKVRLYVGGNMYIICVESIVFFPPIHKAKMGNKVNRVQYNLYQLQARSQYENTCVWQVSPHFMSHEGKRDKSSFISFIFWWYDLEWCWKSYLKIHINTQGNWMHIIKMKAIHAIYSIWLFCKRATNKASCPLADQKKVNTVFMGETQFPLCLAELNHILTCWEQYS